jgi:2-dehydropantoate 2-reductase
VNTPRVAVFGSGAVGSVIAAHHKTTDVNSILVGRNAVVASPDLHVHTAPPISLPVTSYNQFDSTYGNVDIAIITVKAFDVLETIQQVLPLLSKHAHVILLHNGMGTIEPVKELLQNTHFGYFCSFNSGATKIGNDIYLKGQGTNYWHCFNAPSKYTGLLSLSVSQMAQLLPNAIPSDDLTQLLWTKLAVNCAINPLTALLNSPNSIVLKREHFGAIELVLNEVCQVANAMGIKLDPNSLIEKVLHVAKQTSANTSSMLQDIQNGKPTEIDFINGYIVAQGKVHGIPTPKNASLVEQIRQLVLH